LAFSEWIGHISVTTTLAAASGAIIAMITIWIINKKPDASMTLNGALAGLVGITAPCASVSPVSAMIIGGVAGILVVLSVLFIDKILKIDDPVGAVSVHGVCGAWGTLAVGLFAQEKFAAGAGFNGLFFNNVIGDGLKVFGVQALGVAAVFGWVVLAASILFLTLKYTVGLRVKREEEIKGLDIGEHGMEAYSGFQIID
jgi:Amt family ammonium transporter